MSGPLDGKKLGFIQPPPGEERVLLIGRREGSDIHLPFDSQVSRIHAKLGCVSMGAASDPDGATVLTFWLEDGGSRNGTFVEKDDEPIISRVSMRPGTLFRIGRTWLRLDPLLS
jgi:pSer/pThr/pTyr-binding forkhead associated (FHA) protein